MKRHATAVWNGSGKEGKGNLTTQSGVLSKSAYTAASRFENASGTNPEELIAAAHGGCYSMKLAFVLAEKGHAADTIETKCTVTLEEGKITSSHLVVNATVPGISQSDFDAAVENARANCPISKSLNAEITAEATLG